MEDPVAARNKMVREQIEARGVRHAGVLKAMRETPRHLFVPESQRGLCVHGLPVGNRPRADDFAAVHRGFDERTAGPAAGGPGAGDRDRVGLPGGDPGATGAARVQIEIVEPLAKAAGELLPRLGYHNVTVRCGNGWLGLAGAGAVRADHPDRGAAGGAADADRAVAAGRAAGGAGGRGVAGAGGHRQGRGGEDPPARRVRGDVRADGGAAEAEIARGEWRDRLPSAAGVHAGLLPKAELEPDLGVRRGSAPDPQVRLRTATVSGCARGFSATAN